MRSYIAFTLSLLVMFAPKSVVAASFNCVTDRGPDEQAICRDATLSYLDDEMDRAYGSAINTAGSQRDAIRDAQRAFLKQRRACGSNIDCIGSLYRARLTQLQPGQTRFGGKSVVAPSFNCVTDRGPDEQAICRDATLSHLDDEMDRAYGSAINTAGSQRDAIRDDQRAFLKQRRACGSSIDCIGSLYRSRLTQLQPGQTRFGGQAVIESCLVSFSLDGGW